MTNNFYLLRLYNFVMFIRIGLHSPSYFRSCKENVMFTIINILKSSTLFCLVVFCIIAYLPKRSILSFFGCIHIIYEFFQTRCLLLFLENLLLIPLMTESFISIACVFSLVLQKEKKKCSEHML